MLDTPASASKLRSSKGATYRRPNAALTLAIALLALVAALVPLWQGVDFGELRSQRSRGCGPPQIGQT